MSRTPFVPADLLSKLWRAVIEFDMLQTGDKILIGLSGGKDSMFLTAALAEIQKYAPCPSSCPVILSTPCSHRPFPKQSWNLSALTTVSSITARRSTSIQPGKTKAARPALPVLISAVPPPTAPLWSLALTKWLWLITMTTQWRPF